MSFTTILDFVKRQRRIPAADTQYDQFITDDINSCYQQYCRRLQQPPGHPAIRATSTITTIAGTQDYALPANFDRLIDESVQYYNAALDDPSKVVLEIVNGPDAELWETLYETIDPIACRVIAGATGNERKLRLMPAFTQGSYTVSFAYWKRPATLTTGSVLEIPELEDAVSWNALSNSYDYFRDEKSGNSQSRADLRAREAFKQVLGLNLS